MKILHEKFFWFTLLLSTAVLVVFYGHLLWHSNTVLFGKSGDALQGYYQAVYHVEHDTAYWHQQSMQHPFGESIFFTGGQPLVTNFIKLIQPVIDLSDEVVGIINLLMLLGVALGAVALFGVFHELGVRPWFGMCAAVAIAWLSPQVGRMYGHMALCYVVAIPAMVWILMLSERKKSLVFRMGVCAFILFLASQHIYYLAFFGLLFCTWWFTKFIFGKFRLLEFAKQLVLYLVLPFLILSLLIYLGSPAADRSDFPIGLLTYISSWSGLFYPHLLPYRQHLSFLGPPKPVEWEGISYVGMAVIAFGTVAVLYSGVVVVKKKFRGLQLDLRLVFMALCAIVATWVAFAYPLVQHPEWTLYIGKLRQFRGLGRFAWIVFYMINIMVVVFISHVILKKERKAGHVLSGVFLCMLMLDGYWVNISQAHHKDFQRGELLHHAGELKNEYSNYCAILPLPFFHVGSENIWRECSDELQTAAYNLSIATGLPMFSASMSRSSISQSFAMFSLLTEPFEMPSIAPYLQSSDTILIITEEATCSTAEKRLLSLASEKGTYQGMGIYALSVRDMLSMQETAKTNLRQQFGSDTVIDQKGIDTSINSGYFMFEDFEDKDFVSDFFGEKQGVITMNEKQLRLFEFQPNYDSVNVSCWIDNFITDKIPRFRFIITETDLAGKVVYQTEQVFHHCFVGTKCGRALVEMTYAMQSSNNKLHISLMHKFPGEQQITIDNFLVRNNSARIYKRHFDGLSCNNYMYD